MDISGIQEDKNMYNKIDFNNTNLDILKNSGSFLQWQEQFHKQLCPQIEIPIIENKV